MSESGNVQQFEDKVLVCTDRFHPVVESAEFVWTRGEQIFIHRLKEDGKLDGDIQEPKRCPRCRIKKKARYEKFEREGRENY